MLKKWDFKVSISSIEMTLAQFYINSYYESGKIPTMSFGKRTSRLARFDYMSVESQILAHGKLLGENLIDTREMMGGLFKILMILKKVYL